MEAIVEDIIKLIPSSASNKYISQFADKYLIFVKNVGTFKFSRTKTTQYLLHEKDVCDFLFGDPPIEGLLDYAHKIDQKVLKKSLQKAIDLLDEFNKNIIPFIKEGFLGFIISESFNPLILNDFEKKFSDIFSYLSLALRRPENFTHLQADQSYSLVTNPKQIINDFGGLQMIFDNSDLLIRFSKALNSDIDLIKTEIGIMLKMTPHLDSRYSNSSADYAASIKAASDATSSTVPSTIVSNSSSQGSQSTFSSKRPILYINVEQSESQTSLQALDGPQQSDASVKILQSTTTPMSDYDTPASKKSHIYSFENSPQNAKVNASNKVNKSEPALPDNRVSVESDLSTSSPDVLSNTKSGKDHRIQEKLRESDRTEAVMSSSPVGIHKSHEPRSIPKLVRDERSSRKSSRRSPRNEDDPYGSLRSTPRSNREGHREGHREGSRRGSRRDNPDNRNGKRDPDLVDGPSYTSIKNKRRSSEQLDEPETSRSHRSEKPSHSRSASRHHHRDDEVREERSPRSNAGPRSERHLRSERVRDSREPRDDASEKSYRSERLPSSRHHERDRSQRREGEHRGIRDDASERSHRSHRSRSERHLDSDDKHKDRITPRSNHESRSSRDPKSSRDHSRSRTPRADESSRSRSERYPRGDERRHSKRESSRRKDDRSATAFTSPRPDSKDEESVNSTTSSVSIHSTPTDAVAYVANGIVDSGTGRGISGRLSRKVVSNAKASPTTTTLESEGDLPLVRAAFRTTNSLKSPLAPPPGALEPLSDTIKNDKHKSKDSKKKLLEGCGCVPCLVCAFCFPCILIRLCFCPKKVAARSEAEQPDLI